MIGCGCLVCRSRHPRDHRLRSSLHVETEGYHFVIDVGPDFRQQVLKENIPRLDAVLLTHAHRDHVAGLDDIRPFNYKQGGAIPLYARAAVLEKIQREFPYIFHPTAQTGVPRVRLNPIRNEPFLLGDVSILPIEVWHHQLPVYGFRMGDFCYITDAKTILPAEKEKIKGCRVVVVNAIHKAAHIAHFSLSEACELLEEIKPEQAYITHISHQMGIHEAVNRELPNYVQLAYDGLTISC